MGKRREEKRAEYMKELLLQTRPYQYELTYNSGAGGVSEDSPLASALGRIILFPASDGTDIFDWDGIDEQYLIFANRGGEIDKDIVYRLLMNAKDADIIYPDEDYIADDGLRHSPFLKPDYSPDTLMSFGYFVDCFAVRTDIARRVVFEDYDNGMDIEAVMYDFLLKACELSDKIAHVTEVMYHRYDNRSSEEIYTGVIEQYSGYQYVACKKKALTRRAWNNMCELNKNVGNNAAEEKIEHSECVEISAVIPSKDHSDVLKKCIEALIENRPKKEYKLKEIVVVDNGSNLLEREKITNFLRNVSKVPINYLYEVSEFNYSAMCNKGAAAASGDLILFLNDDVTVDSDKVLSNMAEYALYPHIGAVGIKLLYPGGSLIQHVGITNLHSGPGHKLCSFDDNTIYYFGRNRGIWNVLAVTGACLMTSREKYFKIGGFRDTMKVGYNDVDLCVRYHEMGLYNVVRCDVSAVHHESLARGFDKDDNDKIDRLRNERQLFYRYHPDLNNAYDPYYHPNLDHDTIAYGVDCVPDCYITDYRNECERYVGKIKRQSERAHMTVEKADAEYAISPDVEDAYVIGGWSLVMKDDNACLERELLLVLLDEAGNMTSDIMRCDVSPVYRSDVGEVFKEAVNVELAGFVARICKSVLAAEARYRIVMHTFGDGLGRNYYCIGDIYEPRRGIVTDQ